MNETEPVVPALAPLPLADLLARLRDRGLPLGVREHLVVGRLLARFDDPDLETLRAALAAVLARNPAEAELVRETFDELYAAAEEPLPPPPPPGGRERLAGAWSRLRLWSRRRWVTWLATVALILALAVFARSWVRNRILHPPEPKPIEGVTVTPHGEPTPSDRPRPPRISDTYPVPNQHRAVAAAAGAAMLAFLWLYLVRTRRLAQGWIRLLWSEELDARSGPQSYDFILKDLPPPFPAEVLDDVATVLGRQIAGVPRGRDLDVDRTLERTLRAGLAPHIVLRARATSVPVLVLEDVVFEMRPWQRRVEGLLAGLESRGVPLDRWRFDADAGRLFRSIGGPALSLKQLARLRAESPLLVISTGRGVLEGDTFEVAAWVGMLRGWRYRAWLHPATDSRTWSAALRRVPLEVWPMTPAGLLAAARQVARGDVRLPGLKDARTPPERPATPLDVDRLRWLLTLAPRRDPDLAELLRRRFCPHVPEAALIEALAAPPLVGSPGVGPSAAEVHEFLLGVLDDSRPLPEGAGHERWRLDRALQQVRLEPDKAEAELADLAAGPLGGEVERALHPLTAGKGERPLSRQAIRRLESKVLRPIHRRAAREGLLEATAESGAGRRWTWPMAGELAAALIVGVLTWRAAPWFGEVFNDETPVRQEVAFTLDTREPKGGGEEVLLRVVRKPGAPRNFSLYQYESLLRRYESPVEVVGPLSLNLVPRGHWYYVRSRLDRETLAVSPPLWVGPAANPGNLLVRFVSESGLPVAGVRVFQVENGRQSVSDTDGVVILPLPQGVSRLRATKEGYKPVDQFVAMTARQIQIFLQALAPPPAGTGTLVVRFTPPSRTIRTFRMRSGGTSLSGRESKEMELAAGTWRLTSPELATAQQVVIQPGERTLAKFPVDFGYLAISYPPDARPQGILINGQRWSGGPVRLPPGKAVVALQDERYSDQKMVEIVAGETTGVKLTRRREVDGWCCADGKIFAGSEADCKDRRGKFFQDRSQAAQACELSGWCCADGKIFLGSEADCKDRRGKFFVDEDQALKACGLSRGGAAPYGTVFSGSSASCEYRKGKFFEDQLQAMKTCGVSWCCVNGKIFLASEADCKDRQGMFFEDHDQAVETCRFSKSWCCADGKVFSGSQAACKARGGRLFENQAQALKACLQ